MFSVSFELNLACPQRISAFLQSSKTNTFRRGHTLVIVCSPYRSAWSRLCVIISYLRVPGSTFFIIFRSSTHKKLVVYLLRLLRDAVRQAGLPYSSLQGVEFSFRKVVSCLLPVIHSYSAKRSHICRTSNCTRYLILIKTCLSRFGGYTLRTYQ